MISKVSYYSNIFYFFTQFCLHKLISSSWFLPDIKGHGWRESTEEICSTQEALVENWQGWSAGEQPAAASCGSKCSFSDQYHWFLSKWRGPVRKLKKKKRPVGNCLKFHYEPLLAGKMELQPKSVIFTTILLSTTQLVDFRRPWTSVLLECRYDIPCVFSHDKKTKR